jgi:DNA-binding FrmR family transcriptional regulator
MGHLTKNREKLVNRVARIRGQLNAVENGIVGEDDCAAVLQTLVSCRGALNALIGELLEDHVRCHVVDPAKNPSSRASQGAQQLIDLLKTYLR